MVHYIENDREIMCVIHGNLFSIFKRILPKVWFSTALWSVDVAPRTASHQQEAPITNKPTFGWIVKLAKNNETLPNDSRPLLPARQRQTFSSQTHGRGLPCPVKTPSVANLITKVSRFIHSRNGQPVETNATHTHTHTCTAILLRPSNEMEPVQKLKTSSTKKKCPK